MEGKWKCHDCGKVFTEPYEYEICLESEYGVGFEQGRHYETVYICPYCCSANIDFDDYEDEDDEE